DDPHGAGPGRVARPGDRGPDPVASRVAFHSRYAAPVARRVPPGKCAALRTHLVVRERAGARSLHRVAAALNAFAARATPWLTNALASRGAPPAASGCRSARIRPRP